MPQPTRRLFRRRPRARDLTAGDTWRPTRRSPWLTVAAVTPGSGHALVVTSTRREHVTGPAPVSVRVTTQATLAPAAPVHLREPRR